jgi:ubiquinone/menaquinone biosynthesis C-methylase UbiE
LNSSNLNIAQSLVHEEGMDQITFYLDNAEQMNTIKSNSVDIALCIESAFHYSDKTAFLTHINRVLKPNGKFLIADLILKDSKKNNLKVSFIGFIKAFLCLVCL